MTGILLALRTTILNPTIWLLVALAVSALLAMRRREPARTALTRVLGLASRGPVLVALALAVAAGIGSRLVIGYLAPGSYAEEVIAARGFLEARHLYQGDDRRDFSEWVREEPAPVAPWTLPGVTVCQGSAFQSRPRFYTAQGHSPALLLASVPIVRGGGGHALFFALALLSLLALGLVARALIAAAGLPVTSTAAAVVALALGGWQPVLASLRQGDAALVVCGLLMCGWQLLIRRRDLMAGVVFGLAAAVLPPVVVAGIPVGLRSRRALAAWAATLALVAAATVAAAGPLVGTDYLGSTVATARLYAASPMAYSFVSRLLASGAGAQVLALAGAGLVAAATLVALRGTFDVSLATFAALAFLLVPVAWSQHATLLVLPVALLLAHVIAQDRPGGLVAWSVLVLLLSLPDPAVVWVGIGVRQVAGSAISAALPTAPAWAALAIWTWLIVSAVRVRRPAVSMQGATTLQSVP